MLLDTLVREQGEQTDGVFAARLGVPRITWTAIKLGRVALEGRVLLKIARTAHVEFPHLGRLIEETLLPYGPYVSRITGESTQDTNRVA